MNRKQILNVIHFLKNYFSSCLQSWLEQDTSCPTCRLGLSIQNVTPPHADIDRAINDDEIPARPNNHFFHFNGKNYNKLQQINKKKEQISFNV